MEDYVGWLSAWRLPMRQACQSGCGYAFIRATQGLIAIKPLI
jgi:hypothetical protein